VKLNCVAIPEGLLESELFGHEKGSFTGALERRIGKFELANKGTIFLDEIGDMSLTTQAKILRVLQEREFERVGGAQTVRIDTRVIAATNRDLLKAVEEKKFREDLYFRLNVVTLYVPPLRERKDDIPLLVEHFIRTANANFRRNVGSISTEAMELLMGYDWPGNVRELQNYIERAIVLSDEPVIRPSCLPPHVTHREKASAPPVDTATRCLKDVMNDLERQIVLDALSKTNGVQVRAAEILGMTERSLWHLVKKHSIDVEQFR
jgi:transcriptional regulator with GAF, ATPase, and Fis domain